jgi:alpha-maltose-1-phosphate synthase
MTDLRVVLATVGKFHTFDLAREMHRRGWLEAIFTGYPGFKLKNEKLPKDVIRSFPWFRTLYMGRGKLKLNGEKIGQTLAYLSAVTVEMYAAANLPPCDIFMALSSVGLKPGKRAQKRGGVYICDRGSSHIRYQDKILREEYATQGLPFRGPDPRSIVQEEAEYECADMITVPSQFAYRSFVECGIPASKLTCIPYGVDLSRFHPTDVPDNNRFDVLFVGSASVRKGISYLLEGFALFSHPHKQLTMVGSIHPELQAVLDRYSNQPIRYLGIMPQAELKHVMSRSHVVVLPSVEEGLALIQAQAMACGCPIIATSHTGGEDLFQNGIEGFVVPIRDAAAITDRLQQLADDPTLRSRMAEAALQRVKSIGGWETYGESMAALFQSLVAGRGVVSR